MDATTATSLARKMIADHGLTAMGWTFKFDNAPSRLGLCDHTSKTISMGLVYVESEEVAQVEQTMLHEIAHALVGPYALSASGDRQFRNGRAVKTGHGPVWKRKAREIGYNGKRTADNPAAANQIKDLYEHAKAVAPSRAGVTSGPFQIGEAVRTRSGKHSGLIIKLNRVNIVIFDTRNNEPVIVSPAMLTRTAAGATHPLAPSGTSARL